MEFVNVVVDENLIEQEINSDDDEHMVVDQSSDVLQSSSISPNSDNLINDQAECSQSSENTNVLIKGLSSRIKKNHPTYVVIGNLEEYVLTKRKEKVDYH